MLNLRDISDQEALLLNQGYMERKQKFNIELS